MAFVTKEWKDRLVEYAGRRKLKNVATGEEIVYDVSRQEGAVSQAGDAFAAETMNDLEQRISDEFNQVNQNLPFAFGIDANGNYGYYKAGADTVTPFNSAWISDVISLGNGTWISNFSLSIASLYPQYRSITKDNIYLCPTIISCPNQTASTLNAFFGITSYNPSTGVMAISSGGVRMAHLQVRVIIINTTILH